MKHLEEVVHTNEQSYPGSYVFGSTKVRGEGGMQNMDIYRFDFFSDLRLVQRELSIEMAKLPIQIPVLRLLNLEIVAMQCTPHRRLPDPYQMPADN